PTATCPPSLHDALPISSSIHNTQGAIWSASWRDSRKLRSVSPWYLLYRAPISRRNMGSPQSPATDFAARLLPPPCTPNSSSPLGDRKSTRLNSSHVKIS